MKLNFCFAGIVALTLATVLSGCFYTRYFEDEKWAYFEDWDVNDSSAIDSTEFINAYLRNDFFKKWTKGNSISYEEFNNNAAAWKNRKVPVTAESYDINKDMKISADESARAMFLICDEDRDGKVGSLEFYEWEIYL